MMEYSHSMTVALPRHLCITNDVHYGTSIKFFDDLMFGIRSSYFITINFQNCILISPPAALLLFSTINYIQLTYGFERIIISQIGKSSKLINEPMISSSGVWDAINCKNINELDNLIKINNRFKTSCDPSIIKNVGVILRKVAGLNKEHIFFLTMAMKEAITNVIYHAYDPESEVADRWWQAAWVNTRDRVANIIIHDRGKGIIKSYKKANQTDEEALREAMLQGFSSSGLSNRGMGTEDMKRPVNELQGNQLLTVYTGQYIYKYKFSSIEPEIIKRDLNICGTLIHWECGYGG